MNYLGFVVSAVGIVMAMNMEYIHLAILWAPSAIILILFLAFGGTLVTFRGSEIKAAFSACMYKTAQRSKEDWATYGQIFARLSDYTLVAGWIGMILGAIHVLSSYESADGDIGQLAAGVALAFCSPLIGMLMSKFLFDPMRNYAERKAAGAGCADRPVAPDISTPAAPTSSAARTLFKIILFSTVAIVFISVVVLVSWKVASMQQEPRDEQAGDTQDTVARIPQSAAPLLAIFQLGERERRDFNLVVMDRGEKHRLQFTIYLGYSQDYDMKGAEFHDELRRRLPMLREIVIRVMGAKSLDELQTQNMNRIEEELLSRINEVLENGSVADIMFSHYVID